MKHEYTVETQGGMTCGHRHRTAQAAEQCRRRLCDDARYYGAEVGKNGVRANGVGLWADGEARFDAQGGPKATRQISPVLELLATLMGE